MPDLKGLAAGERLTPDGSRKYYRLVLEPAPVFGFFDRDFAHGARQVHEGLAGSNLVIPTHPPAVLTDIDAYVIDVVTHPQARNSTVADLAEYVDRYNLTTRLRSVERVGASNAGASSAAAADRARTEQAVVRQKESEGPVATVANAATSVARSVMWAVLATLALYALLVYGGKR